jgi:5'-nucleotidase
LFLSCNEEDVSSAVNRGFAAAVIYNGYKYDDIPEDQIRIAFDADAVLFSAESEEIFQKQGLDAFVQNEIDNQDLALEKGPMAKFLFGLARLQRELSSTDKIRTAIVTARDKDSGRRVIKTLRKWNININEIFFLLGADKADILESFGANIFFDDQEKNALPAAKVVPSARVPYKKG